MIFSPRRIRPVTVVGAAVAALAAGLAGVALSGGAAGASTDHHTVYSFTLNGTSSFVSNGAAVDRSARLHLTGPWSRTRYGVHFERTAKAGGSVGYYRPAAGYTLDVAADHSVGAAVAFAYQAPRGGCFGDSPNLTQIGRFATRTGQIKLQLSSCQTSRRHVYAECRVAGSATPRSAYPVTSTLRLVDGHRYVAECVKGRDRGSISGVRLRVARIGSTSSSDVAARTYRVAAIGRVRSTQYLSVGNKYPVPSGVHDTDQFTGDVSKIAYCQGLDAPTTMQCLRTDVPSR